jgi:hypothetical protein
MTNFSGPFKIINFSAIEKKSQRTDDPRHVFYQAMLAERTYEAYDAAVGKVTVEPKTTSYLVTGAMEIRYVRNQLRWIVDG